MTSTVVEVFHNFMFFCSFYVSFAFTLIHFLKNNDYSDDELIIIIHHQSRNIRVTGFRLRLSNLSVYEDKYYF